MVAAAGGQAVLEYSAIPDDLKAALFCFTDQVTYEHRLENGYNYNFCVVPNTSYDVVLFGGLAVVLACILVGKLNTLMVLLAGIALMALAYPVNLGALGNSLAIWLGISPWQLFFYVFLPPLLLDAAVRIDWFMFRKSVVQVFTLAFLVVGATCVVMIPIMLYMLQLNQYGWNWIHACMFGAMIASTDAVAIVSIMKTSGGPKRLRVMLEGESLLNDASGLTLFEVFFHLLQVQMEHPEDSEPIGVIVGHVFLAVFQLGIIGFIMGLVFGTMTRLLLRFMRYLGAGHDQEVALTLGMAYLAYWVTAIPCKGSGVVAVAVMGLYGAATNCWDMSTHAHHTFDGFWETLAFVVNSLVFLYSGASVVNFFIRAAKDLLALGPVGNADLITTLYMMPVIYVILSVLRFALTMAFRPLFIAIKGDMSFKECIFICVAGLRGSASLIMGSAVVTYQMHGTSQTFNVVKAMMVFWTAGFVLLTLLINAPLLPTVLRWTGLSKVPEKQLARRQRAVAALGAHTAEVLEQLRDAEDELLAGVDWAQVAAFVDHGRKYTQFTGQHTHKVAKWRKLLLRLYVFCCCCCGRAGRADHGGLRRSNSRSAHEGAKATGSHYRGSGAKPPGSHHRHSKHGARHAKNSDSAPDLGPAGLPTLFSRDVTTDVEDGTVAAAAPSADSGAAVAANGAAAAAAAAQDGMAAFPGGSAAGAAAGKPRRAASRKSSKASRQSAFTPGDVSDAEGSSSSSSAGSGSVTGSDGDTSNSESEEDGLLTSVLPAFGGFGNTADIDMLECPFMGSTFGSTGSTRAHAAHPSDGTADQVYSSASGAAATAAAARTSKPAGPISRFWAARSRKLITNPTSDVESPEQQQQQVQLQTLPPKTQPVEAAPADQPADVGSTTRPSPALPPVRVSTGGTEAAAAAGSGGAKPASAFAAATASRTGSASASSGGWQAVSNPAGAPGSPALRAKSTANAPSLRSLATRSAAPAFVYGDSQRALAGNFGADAGAAPPGHVRNSSAGNSAAFAALGGGGSAGGWGLTTTVKGAPPDGGLASAADADADWSGSRSSKPPTAPLALQMDKALGRTSGAYRGLATRSVNLGGGDRKAGGPGFSAGFDGAVGSAGLGSLHPHVPEGAPMSAVQPGADSGYDAAAAAVDMVSLARSSKRAGAGSSGSLVSAASGGLGRGPAAPRGLASRSMGMAGAYTYPRGHGSDQDLQSLSAAGVSTGGSFSRPASAMIPAASSSMARQDAGPPQHLRSLATRSVNMHAPGMAAVAPIAPIAPSLHTISTGLGGYRPGAAAAAIAVGADQAALAKRAGVERSLGCNSVPAAASARNRLTPSAADAVPTATPFGTDAINNDNTADAAAGANSSSSALNALSRISKVMGRISKVSGFIAGNTSRGASRAGGDGDSSDWEGSGYDLGKMSSYGRSCIQMGVTLEELADARSWLLSGLKRYFYGKRMEGLLSARGLRILDASCEVGLEDPSKPLALWRAISRDVGNNLLVRLLTSCLFLCRRASVWLHSHGMLGRWLAYALRILAAVLQRPLNKVLLSSVEVAMEYLMGLTTSPYVEWLQEGELWTVLMGEIQAETSQVARFLIDREIEAPERYSAVQSYRVAMAVLRQQRLFVESLFESGMLDAAEQSMLAHPIEAAERRLELLGPVWKAPGLSEVLRQLPFMRGQSQTILGFFIKYGHLVMLGKGSKLPEGRDLYIIQSGIVQVTYQPDLGSAQEYFLGAGGVCNLYQALTGEELPGTTTAIAQGNAMGKGPVLFCFSAKGLNHLSALAAAGDPAFQQLELDMYRLVGLFLIERLKPQFEMEVSQALARLAPMHSKSTNGSDKPVHRQKRMSRQQRAAWVRQHLNVLRGHLKQQLVKAELLMLPAGCAVSQESHVLLLQGSIQVKVADEGVMADPSSAEIARWMVSAGRHQHASILPWLWEVLSEQDLQAAPVGTPQQQLPVTITAGPEGATLLVCPSAAEEAALASAAAPSLPRSDSLLRQPARTGSGGPPLAKLSAGHAATESSLARLSSSSAGAAAAAAAAAAPAAATAKPAAASGLAAQLAAQKSANPFLRRTLAAAVAVDSVMEPLPSAGKGLKAGDAAAATLTSSVSMPAALTAAISAAAGASAAGTPAAAALPPSASLPAVAGTAAAAAPLSLSRVSPTIRDLARASPIRVLSTQPLAGAGIDNSAFVGASSHGGSAQDPAAVAAAGLKSTSDLETSGDEQLQQQQQQAAPAAARQMPRRNRSLRPLKAGGGRDAADAVSMK